MAEALWKHIIHCREILHDFHKIQLEVTRESLSLSLYFFFNTHCSILIMVPNLKVLYPS